MDDHQPPKRQTGAGRFVATIHDEQGRMITAYDLTVKECQIDYGQDDTGRNVYTIRIVEAKR